MLEIAIVAYAIYRVLLLLHRSRAVPVLIGIVVLLLTYAMAAVLKLTMIVTSRLVVTGEAGGGGKITGATACACAPLP